MIYVANALVLIALILLMIKITLFPVALLILAGVQIYHNKKIFSEKK